MRTIIYCRVSNLKKDSFSFATQEEQCVNYCKTNGYTVREIHKEFNSGYGKQRILQNIFLKYKDINLVISDITRFSRNLKLGRALMNASLKKNIVLHFVKEQLIFDGDNNPDMVAGLIDAGLRASESEWHSIRDRIIANIHYRRASGMCLGNPPFGFDSVNKKLVKNNDFNVVRLIIGLRNGVQTSKDLQQILSTHITTSNTLRFFDENDNEIIKFAKPLTLDFKNIADILNSYNLSNKHWTGSKAKNLYDKYCKDLEFRYETESTQKKMEVDV